MGALTEQRPSRGDIGGCDNEGCSAVLDLPGRAFFLLNGVCKVSAVHFEISFLLEKKESYRH
jgi:hypothetical protein